MRRRSRAAGTAVSSNNWKTGGRRIALSSFCICDHATAPSAACGLRARVSRFTLCEGELRRQVKPSALPEPLRVPLGRAGPAPRCYNRRRVPAARRAHASQHRLPPWPLSGALHPTGHLCPVRQAPPLSLFAGVHPGFRSRGHRQDTVGLEGLDKERWRSFCDG